MIDVFDVPDGDETWTALWLDVTIKIDVFYCNLNVKDSTVWAERMNKLIVFHTDAVDENQRHDSLKARSHWWNSKWNGNETAMKQIEPAWTVIAPTGETALKQWWNRLNHYETRRIGGDETMMKHVESGWISNETICFMVTKRLEKFRTRMKRFVSWLRNTLVLETCWASMKNFVSRPRNTLNQNKKVCSTVIVMSRWTYAAAAWRGYASSAECNNIQEFLINAKRWELISEDINFDDILNVHESKLFI